VESHQPVTFPSCGSIKVFLETITILLGFDSFVDDAVVGEQSELAGFQIFWQIIYIYQKKNRLRTVPCGTPEVTEAISDDSPSRTTVCVRFDRKAEIQFNVSFLIP
jgi:hypothetical protein